MEETKIEKIEQIKKQLLELQSEVISEVKTDLERTKDFETVNRISNNPSVITVPLSEIAKSPGHILSPEYYDLPAQAQAVVEKIAMIEEKHGSEAYCKIGKLLDDICKNKTVTTSRAGKIKLHENLVKTVESIKLCYFKEN